MSDYISREALAAEMKERQTEAGKWLREAKDHDTAVRADAVLSFLCEVKLTLDKLPAADVRPVVRGKWKPDYDSTEYDFDGSTPLLEPRIFQDGWQCSLCGQYTPSETNFCHNCGADMREES